jgi:CMP-N,N'-diacetyllegionaminic acid synthase
MTTPAIILARGGSKGVPGKNKRTIAGRACFEWVVADAIAAGLRPIVTSDDHEIIESAVSSGLEVVIRPSELANDTATVQDSVRHACHAKGIDTGPVVVLYGCVPVRPKWLISSALAVLESTGADSVQSYCGVGKCHPAWLAFVGKDGAVFDYATWTAGDRPHRRQDLDPVYVPDGGVIVVRDTAKFFGDTRQSVITNPGDVIDIDTERDAMLAEVVLNTRLGVPADTRYWHTQEKVNS